MAKYEIKDGVVVVKYHITEDLVNTRIPFLRAYSRLKPSEGITAVYVDGQTKKIPPKSSITFNEVGEHIAKIVLENAEVIPYDFLREAKHIHSVEIPECVTEIGDFAFRWTNIECPPELPSKLKTIGCNAFDGAYVDVDCVQIPDSVEKIGSEAFGGVRHLILGRSFQGYLEDLDYYDKVTIPMDNPFTEIREGFVIEKANQTVQCILKNAFEDSEDVTIRLPEDVSGFNRDLFSNFSKAAIYIPGSVEKVVIESDCKSIECAEGVKEIIIHRSSNASHLKLIFPSTITRLELHNCEMEDISVPAGTVFEIDDCNFGQLYLDSNVVLEAGSWSGIFKGCKGEVFIKGPIQFDEWNWMEDGSIIHVPDEATAAKIFNSPEFNKQVKIYIGADKPFSAQENGSQEQDLFSLLGCPDYPFTLKPIGEGYGGSAPEYLILLFNLPQKATVTIDVKDPFTPEPYEYMLDDGELKKIRGKKISMPKGLHILRLKSRWLSDDIGGDMVIEPVCESMLIPDIIEPAKIKLSGVKHLIIGAQCRTLYLPQSVERISVVPENNFLECREGRIYRKGTDRLLYPLKDLNLKDWQIEGYYYTLAKEEGYM